MGAEYRHEIDPVKGSRFVCSVAPADSVEVADAFVGRVRSELSGASHHCWAYRIGRAGELFRSSDDGEPGGSAGRPILAQLEGHDLTDTAVVVTRWFGGTKLGVGGLMRAYGGAAGQALDRVPLRTVVVTRTVQLAYPYECTSAVQGLLAARGLVAEGGEYGETVALRLELPERDIADFERELRDRTSGRGRIL